MAGAILPSLALVVRSHSYERRLARADADLALAAAALDFEIHVYFVGRSILQLVTRREVAGALLPAGYRAWSALPEMGEARVCVDEKWWSYCEAARLELVMPVETLTEADMKQSWRSCNHIVAL